MFKKKVSASLTALALFSFAMGAEAIALGDLNIESKLGEPFEAKLKIVDVDPSISPLLVRIAPPSVYERQQKKAPVDIYALKMERLSGGETVVLRVYSEAPLADNRFPLLIEMNAGGTITLKNYDLALAYPLPAAEKPLAIPAPAAPAAPAPRAEAVAEAPAPRVAEAPAPAPRAAAPVVKAERIVLHEKTADAERARRAETDAEKEARLALDRQQDQELPNPTARSIVQDYIALNGFDASSPMRIQHGMTLWSVARVYWPSYRGATAEQILIGFRNQNRAAFVNGDPGQLQKGAMLYPPSKEDVFAINPMEAFREIHGDNVAVPLATQNLIDAQLVDAELAGSVADAQDRARTAGENPQTIAAAGRTALEDQKAERVYERNLMSADGTPLGETRQTLTEAPTPDQKAQEAEEKKAAEAAAAAAAEAEKAKAAAAAADKKSGFKLPEGINWTWVMGILLLLGFGLFFRNRAKSGSCCEDKADGKSCCCGQPVTVQKEIPPSTDAQIQALKTTVDEAVKNGTTGGAMGAGTAVFMEAQMAEERKAEEMKGRVEPAPVEVKKPEPFVEPKVVAPAPKAEPAPKAAPKAAPQTVAIEEKAFKADEPIEPVVAPEETGLSPADRAVIEKTKKVLESVSLELDENASVTDFPAKADTTAKDQAYTEALDARIQLAEGFIKYGAIAEANEVFEEVKRRGTPEQKARMNAILAAVNKEGAK